MNVNVVLNMYMYCILSLRYVTIVLMLCWYNVDRTGVVLLWYHVASLIFELMTKDIGDKRTTYRAFPFNSTVFIFYCASKLHVCFNGVLMHNK